MRIVSLCLWVGDRSLTVVSAYGPNSSAEYLAFLEALGGVLKSAPTGDSIHYRGTSTLTWAVKGLPGVGGELLHQMEEFKCLGVLFRSEGRMECEIDRWIGAAAAVMQSLYLSVMVKRELSRKAKLSIYPSIYIPTLTYGHELWVMTK